MRSVCIKKFTVMIRQKRNGSDRRRSSRKYYSQGEWVFQDDGEKADLETARIAVERELREKKYDAMIAQMTEDLEVSGDLEAVDRFTLDHLKR